MSSLLALHKGTNTISQKTNNFTVYIYIYKQCVLAIKKPSRNARLIYCYRVDSLLQRTSLFLFQP